MDDHDRRANELIQMHQTHLETERSPYLVLDGEVVAGLDYMVSLATDHETALRKLREGFAAELRRASAEGEARGEARGLEQAATEVVNQHGQRSWEVLAMRIRALKAVSRG